MNSSFGFFVLTLINLVQPHGLVVSVADLGGPLAWALFAELVTLFLVLIGVAGMAATLFPRSSLLDSGAQANPVLADSALRDQVEDVIALRIPPDQAA